MAVSFIDLPIWITSLWLMFLQGYESLDYCKYTIGLYESYEYCAYGCCYTHSIDPCCTIPKYYSYNSAIYWGIGAGVLIVIGFVIVMLVCCCCLKQRTAGTLVNGAPTQVLCSNDNVQTAYMQPGVTYPAQQPGLYPSTQLVYYPPQPAYYPQNPTAVPPPSCVTAENNAPISGGQDNEGFK